MNKQRICLYIFLIFAIVYLVTIPFHPYPAHFIIKAIPIMSLAILALTKIPGPRGKLLFVALLFSSSGDVVLSLESGKYFVTGLGLFLIAHIIYIVTFAIDVKMQKPRIPVAAILAVYSLVMAFFIAPSLNEMALPVFIYLSVITIMGIFAIFRASPSNIVLYGAMLFIVSDSIIAINRFMTPVAAADYFIMATYYLAQFFIVIGFSKEIDMQSIKK